MNGRKKRGSATTSRPGDATVNQVNVTKPDGTGIIIEAENVADSAKQPHADPPHMPPPLSLDQLKALALDPGLTLYPRAARRTFAASPAVLASPGSPVIAASTVAPSTSANSWSAVVLSETRPRR